MSILRTLIADDSENTSGIASRIRELLKAAQATLIAEKKVYQKSIQSCEKLLGFLISTNIRHVTTSWMIMD